MINNNELKNEIVTKKCYYSNTSKFLYIFFYSSIAVNKKNEKKEFRLVRFHQEHDHLGIFVARQNQVDIGCFGYFVVHIIPDGLVKR